MLDTLICEAIGGRKLLMYEYGGLIRLVEPHLLGATAGGNALLSGWLRPGYSRSDPNGGWRTWRVDRITSAQVIDYRFDAPRPGYNPDDPRMAHVVCALPAAEPRDAGTREAGRRDADPDDLPPDAIAADPFAPADAAPGAR